MISSIRPLFLASTLVLGSACIVTNIGDDEVGDTGDGDGDGDGDGEGESSSSGEGDGDGDGDTTGDGDGDGDTTGDGDGDTTGDGDGDTTGDGDGDGDTTGDGDGDTTGDGDGDCDPMDAMNGPERCWNPRGWFWNGETCEQITCTCDGSECNALFPNEVECLDAYAQCELPPPPECDADDAIGVGMCDAFFGYAWNGSECVGLSGCSCEGIDCEGLPLELEPCQLEHAACEEGEGGCPGVMQAEGEGLCALFLGYKWNGESCVGVSGCSCNGPDCESLFGELVDCEVATAGC